MTSATLPHSSRERTNLTPPQSLPLSLETALAAAAGMDLGLEHDRTADLVEGLLRLGRRRRDDAARHRRPRRRQQFLGLVFVDLHCSTSPGKR